MNTYDEKTDYVTCQRVEAGMVAVGDHVRIGTVYHLVTKVEHTTIEVPFEQTSGYDPDTDDYTIDTIEMDHSIITLHDGTVMTKRSSLIIDIVDRTVEPMLDTVADGEPMDEPGPAIVAVTNGRIVWFDCRVQDDRLMFGARVNGNRITSEMGTIELSDEMRVMDTGEAHAVLLGVVRNSDATPRRLAQLFGWKTNDMVDLAMLMRERRLVSGTRVTNGAFVMRSRRSIAITREAFV